MINKRSVSCFAALILGVSGCAVGPDFQGGRMPQASSYTATPVASVTGAAAVKLGEAQTFRNGADIPEQWWTLFQSKELDALIREALTANPGLSAAEAALREAQENVNARVGSAYYPSAAVSAGSSRQKVSPASGGQPDGKGSIFDLHHASVTVSYMFDIFGGTRREVEALKAKVDYEKFRLQGAYLSLSGNVVTTVIQEAMLRELLKAAGEIVMSQEKQVALLEKQLAMGGASRSDVLSLRAQLEATRATLPAYQKDLSRTRHQLAALVGKLPGDLGGVAEFDLGAFALPVELPVSLPGDMARQRPDVRAAEALLHAASATVGVASANLYPQITLSGAYGPQAGQLDNIFKAESLVWNLGAGVTQPIFNGGALRARKRAAVAAYDQTAAYFRQTVIGAFQDVADVLKALEADAAVLKAQADAELAARDALAISRQQFEAGAVNSLFVLNAERQYQESRIGLIRAQAARLADTAALFQALGGGWWNSADGKDGKLKDI